MRSPPGSIRANDTFEITQTAVMTDFQTTPAFVSALKNHDHAAARAQIWPGRHGIPARGMVGGVTAVRYECTFEREIENGSPPPSAARS